MTTVHYGDMVCGRFCEITAEYQPRPDDSPDHGPEEALLIGVEFDGVDIRSALAAQHPDELLRLRRECWARVLLELDTLEHDASDLKAWGGR